jgi:hypothetical protein
MVYIRSKSLKIAVYFFGIQLFIGIIALHFFIEHVEEDLFFSYYRDMIIGTFAMLIFSLITAIHIGRNR